MAYSSVLKQVIPSKWIAAQIQADSENGMTDGEIIKRFNENGYGFKHPMFTELERKTLEEDDYISNPPDVEEGVVECKKCGSKKVMSVSVQTRAADEPMSTRAFCTSCRARWTQNC